MYHSYNALSWQIILTQIKTILILNGAYCSDVNIIYKLLLPKVDR